MFMHNTLIYVFSDVKCIEHVYCERENRRRQKNIVVCLLYYNTVLL
jgi:hypothetical protein